MNRKKFTRLMRKMGNYNGVYYLLIGAIRHGVAHHINCGILGRQSGLCNHRVSLVERRRLVKIRGSFQCL